MSSTPVFQALGDLFYWSFSFFEYVQNGFNDILIVLAFVGIGFWMYTQYKYDLIAKNNPDQLR